MRDPEPNLPPPDPDPEDPHQPRPDPDEPGPDVIGPGLDPQPIEAQGCHHQSLASTPANARYNAKGDENGASQGISVWVEPLCLRSLLACGSPRTAQLADRVCGKDAGGSIIIPTELPVPPLVTSSP
jgi:hypothetical protein